MLVFKKNSLVFILCQDNRQSMQAKSPVGLLQILVYKESVSSCVFQIGKPRAAWLGLHFRSLRQTSPRQGFVSLKLLFHCFVVLKEPVG